MSLKEKINADFMEAYKAKDMDKKNFLGVLKGSIQTQEGKMIESTDENVLKVIKTFEKSINEMLQSNIKLGVSTEEQERELSYLKPYLPTLMSESEIRSLVKAILTRDGINKNIGFLMGVFNKEQNGKAFDNKLVSTIIKEEVN